MIHTKPQRRTTATICWIAAAAAATVAAFVRPAPADDWPQWLGPHRDGNSAEAAWRLPFDANSPKVLWKAKVGAGYSSVAVNAGRLYTLGNVGDVDTLWCLNARTGAVVWKHSYPCSATAPQTLVRLYAGTRSTPTVAGGKVYVFSRDGQLLCLSADDGKPAWSVDVKAKPLGLSIPSWGFACSPLVAGGRVVLDAGPLVAFDPATGKCLWQSKPYKPGYSSPVTLDLAGRSCIATLNGTGLAIVDAADGKEVLAFPFARLLVENCVTPIFWGDLCFISAGEGQGSALVRLGKDKAVQVWRGDQMLNVSTNSVLHKGYLYGFHGGALGLKSFRCVDLQTGKTQWETRSLREGAVMIAGGRLIAIGGHGDLAIIAATPARYTPLARGKVLSGTCWTVPALSGGLIYCRDADGELVCVDGR
jgi:outer membrane protein assembly factor BamB